MYELTKEDKIFLAHVTSNCELFYAQVDKEHGVEHVTRVMMTALDMNHKLKLGINTFDIILAGMTHDIFAKSNRNNHHTMAHDWLLTKAELFAGIGSIELVAKAVAEHRASYKGEYSSALSELISAADRDKPDLHALISRVYGCAIEPELIFEIDKGKPIPDIIIRDNVRLPALADDVKKNGYTEAICKTYIHILEKYSRFGYARRNNIFTQYYRDELEEFYNTVSELTPEDVLIVILAKGIA